MNAAFAVVLGALVTGQLPPLDHVATWDAGLEGPARIAVGAGEILVTDPVANRIVRFDPAGSLLGTWPVPEGPVGVAVHPDGRIFVSRRDDAVVAVYDAAFTFLRLIDPVIGPLAQPTDLAVDPASGRLYVVDTGADRFFVFDGAEALVMVVGQRGELLSEFKSPSAVAYDPLHDHIVVADQENFRIQVFNSLGIPVIKFGYRNIYLPGGEEEGWMPRTAGLAVDSAGNILVTDALMGTVRIFDPTGQELGRVGTYGHAPGELRTPIGIALDGAGRVLVVNRGQGAVEVYDPPTFAPLALQSSDFRTASRHAFAAIHVSQPFDGALWAEQRAVPGWDPPHMLEDTVCGRCHGIVAVPGGHEGLIEGQANLCFSCHYGAGQAQASLMLPTANLGMSHAWGVDAVNAAAGSVGPAPDGAMIAYLDTGRIKCATCHEQHNYDSGSPFLRGAANALCRECHASHPGHTVSGPWQPDCMDCHAAHDARHRNLGLVSGTVHNQTLGLDKPVVLTARTGPNSFDDGDPAATDGICQVCHTATSYHTHDGVGAAHFNGQDCVACHPHDNGFLPAGGDCIGCHSVAQGLRRAVVGEFPADDAHAHYGVELNSDACLVCHSLDTHMNGFVELLDADTNILYSFQQPADLASDPDLSDFCASCHDADGAVRLANPSDPFNNGNAAPNVATKFAGSLQWYEQYGDGCFGTEGTLRAVNSHHDISDADQAFSGAKIECLDCHGAHQAGATQPLVDPYAKTNPWVDSGTAFCLACHAGGMGPFDPAFPPAVVGPVLDPAALLAENMYVADFCTNGTGDCAALRPIDSCDYPNAPWFVDYSWDNTAHGPNSKRGWNSYSGAPAATLDCMVCHDPHGSYTDTHTAGNPYAIRDIVDGTAYVDDGYRVGANWTGPPWDTFGTTGVVEVTIDGLSVDWGNGLCVVCHADWESSQHFHGSCTGCQTCHGHGMAWGEHDWAGGDDNTPCPTPLKLAPQDGIPPIHRFGPQGSGAVGERRQPVRSGFSSEFRIECAIPTEGR